jgi:hypothetical protein
MPWRIIYLPTAQIVCDYEKPYSYRDWLDRYINDDAYYFYRDLAGPQIHRALKSNQDSLKRYKQIYYSNRIIPKYLLEVIEVLNV